jgi:hypothetical protein
LHLEKAKLWNRVFYLIGARVESGRFQAYGSTGFNLYSPTVVEA